MQVQTVLGPIDPSQLGMTLTHEHIQCNLFRVTRSTDDYMDEDVEVAIEDILKFKQAGGRSIVDCTNLDLGRKPEVLRHVAQVTGINVIMGCGWYREPYYDDRIFKRTTREVAADIVREIEEGVDGSGIKPGVIGEIGTDREWMSGVEERSFRAAGRAQVRTGLPLITHTSRARIALTQLDVLEEEGVDLNHVVVSHCDGMPDPDYHEAIAKRGAYVEFDRPTDRYARYQERRVAQVLEIARRGHLDRLVLAQDVCQRPDRSGNGGPGYHYVATTMRDQLQRAGLSDEQFCLITVENPRRWLSGEK